MIHEFANKPRFLKEVIDFDGEVHETFSQRNLSRARQLATYLVDDKGHFDLKKAKRLYEGLKAERFFSHPGCLAETRSFESVMRILSFLLSDKEAQLLIKRLTPPLANPFVEDLIRHSLLLPKEAKLSSKEIKIALLSALFTELRQSVGSCFATATAILVQKEQPKRILKDLYDLITTGRLSRTAEGHECKIPLSIKTGPGDLYTQVSLSEPLKKAFSLIQVALPSIDKTKSVAAFIKGSLLEHFGLKQWQLNRKEKLPPPNSPFASQSFDIIKKLEKREQVIALEKEAQEIFKAHFQHPLLKAWEYTIASFSDYKIDFYKWNMYTGLGLDHEETEGIGQLLYKFAGEKLDEFNEKISKLNVELQISHDSMRVTENLMSTASDHDKLRRLKVELQMKAHQFFIQEEERDEAAKQAKYYSELHPFLVHQYQNLFPAFFQELYDPDMFSVVEDSRIYEDCPAGFRLVYKNRSIDPSQWVMIHTQEEYIEALSDFFHSTEQAILAACETEEGKDEIPFITKMIIDHIENPSFLKYAKLRTKKMHKKYLNENDIERVPWAYTSGGSLSTLVRAYFGYPQELDVQYIKPKNETDLAIELIELMKGLPTKLCDTLAKDPHKSLLIHSTNHAFLFQPGLLEFKKAWEDRGNTHTYVRDHFVEPARRFYDQIELGRDEQQFLLSGLKADLSLLSPSPLSVQSFRALFLNTSEIDNVDSLLRSSLPFIKKKQVNELFSALGIKQKAPHSIMPFRLVYNAIWMAFISQEKHVGNRDIHLLVQEHLKEYFPPKPLLFADTNWAQFNFGFLVNPGTGNFELWRIESQGVMGKPMSIWRHHFLEENNQWGIFINPFQYGGRYISQPKGVKV